MKIALRFASLLLLCSASVWAQPPAGAPGEISKISPEELQKLIGLPTTISLKMEAPASDILQEIGKQANVTFGNLQGAQLANAERLTVDFKNEPFWSAVQKVGSEANLHINSWPAFGFGVSRQQDLTVMRFGGARKDRLPTLSAALSPYIWFDVRSVVANQSRTLGFESVFSTPVNKENRSITLGANLLLDPKLSRLPVAMEMLINSATTDTGAALQATPPYLQNGVLTRNFTLSLANNEAPNNAPESKKIASLRGKLIMVVARNRETWEIPDVMNAKDVMKNIRMPNGVWKFTFSGMKRVAGRYTTSIVADRPANPSVPIGAIPPPGQRALSELSSAWTRSLRLEDAQGQLFFSGGGSTRGDGNSLVADMTFSEPIAFGDVPKVEPGPPAKLTIEIPTDFRQIEIPFEIRDIPLP